MMKPTQNLKLKTPDGLIRLEIFSQEVLSVEFLVFTLQNNHRLGLIVKVWSEKETSLFNFEVVPFLY